VYLYIVIIDDGTSRAWKTFAFSKLGNIRLSLTWTRTVNDGTWKTWASPDFEMFRHPWVRIPLGALVRMPGVILYANPTSTEWHLNVSRNFDLQIITSKRRECLILVDKACRNSSTTTLISSQTWIVHSWTSN
jgi:hypothetical protein